MSNPFFDHPILNSPYEYPSSTGNSTRSASRRSSHRAPAACGVHHAHPEAEEAEALPQRSRTSYSTKARAVDARTAVRPDLDHQRGAPAAWTLGATLPSQNQWQVTPETARLLQHWRHHEFNDVRPFFCQVEAAETAIWLTEVAPQSARRQAPPRPSRQRPTGTPIPN